MAPEPDEPPPFIVHIHGDVNIDWFAFADAPTQRKRRGLVEPGESPYIQLQMIPRAGGVWLVKEMFTKALSPLRPQPEQPEDAQLKDTAFDLRLTTKTTLSLANGDRDTDRTIKVTLRVRGRRSTFELKTAKLELEGDLCTLTVELGDGRTEEFREFVKGSSRLDSVFLHAPHATLKTNHCELRHGPPNLFGLPPRHVLELSGPQIVLSGNELKSDAARGDETRIVTVTDACFEEVALRYVAATCDAVAGKNSASRPALHIKWDNQEWQAGAEEWSVQADRLAICSIAKMDVEETLLPRKVVTAVGESPPASSASSENNTKTPEFEICTYEEPGNLMALGQEKIRHSIWELGRYPKEHKQAVPDGEEVLRLSRLWGHVGDRSGRPRYRVRMEKRNGDGDPRILVFFDANAGCREGDDYRSLEWRNLLKKSRPTNETGKPDEQSVSPIILAVLDRELPEFLIDSQNECDRRLDDRSSALPLWDCLYWHHRKRTVVIVSSKLLRQSGVYLSRAVSWERSALDFVHELGRNDILRKLAEFRHLVVRLGFGGAIHCYRHHAVETEPTSVLYYDPVAVSGQFREAGESGDVGACNIVFAASIARRIYGRYMDPLTRGNDSNTELDKLDGLVDPIGEGVRHAIGGCQELFRQGYGDPKERLTNLDGSNGAWIGDKVFGRTEEDKPLIAKQPLQLRADSWGILRDELHPKLDDIAEKIVRFGSKKALTKPLESDGSDRQPKPNETYPPVAEFAKLILVDRMEIESYTNIWKMMRDYLNRTQKEPPLSIAVFGAPGSGKSFGVSQLAESIDRGGKRMEILAYNLSQIATPSELEIPFSEVREANLKDKTALAFFDEFDCELDGVELAWLKHFLAPMQDGLYRYKDQMWHLGKAIFVFAGGTTKDFGDFSRAEANVGSAEYNKWVSAKGIDFVSRLRGHVDIVGIDQKDHSDSTYKIRRAILLRAFLQSKRLVASDDEHANIQAGVLHAMLNVPRYRHGARSMEAVIDMCVPVDGRLEKASLPSVPHLNMHVDGQEFVRLVNERR